MFDAQRDAAGQVYLPIDEAGMRVRCPGRFEQQPKWQGRLGRRRTFEEPAENTHGIRLPAQ
jgi:hypothetical protein